MSNLELTAADSAHHPPSTVHHLMNAVKFNDNLLAWGTGITAVLIGIPLCYAAISEHVQTRADVTTVMKITDDEESRLRVLEKEVPEMRANFLWIRQALEKLESKKLADNGR
jgi:hypothetical protein